jgi:IS30 family transposase
LGRPQADFFEADLMAHCGTSTHGPYLSTFALTDVATGWTECCALVSHDQERILRALKQVRTLLPFPLQGLDTDNGSEFINYQLLHYCQQEQITFTRCRPYKKNDQCHVEQKNGSLVRRMIGYDRFEGSAACR